MGVAAVVVLKLYLLVERKTDITILCYPTGGEKGVTTDCNNVHLKNRGRTFSSGSS